MTVGSSSSRSELRHNRTDSCTETRLGGAQNEKCDHVVLHVILKILLLKDKYHPNTCTCREVELVLFSKPKRGINLAIQLRQPCVPNRKKLYSIWYQSRCVGRTQYQPFRVIRVYFALWSLAPSPYTLIQFSVWFSAHGDRNACYTVDANFPSICNAFDVAGCNRYHDTNPIYMAALSRPVNRVTDPPFAALYLQLTYISPSFYRLMLPMLPLCVLSERGNYTSVG